MPEQTRACEDKYRYFLEYLQGALSSPAVPFSRGQNFSAAIKDSLAEDSRYGNVFRRYRVLRERSMWHTFDGSPSGCGRYMP